MKLVVFGKRKVKRLKFNIIGNGSGNSKSNINDNGLAMVIVMVYTTDIIM